MTNLDCSKFAESVGKLYVKFTSRFSVFMKCEKDFKLFSPPFDVESPNCYQMELIDGQSNMNLRKAYDNNDKVGATCQENGITFGQYIMLSVVLL